MTLTKEKRRYQPTRSTVSNGLREVDKLQVKAINYVSIWLRATAVTRSLQMVSNISILTVESLQTVSIWPSPLRRSESLRTSLSRTSRLHHCVPQLPIGRNAESQIDCCVIGFETPCDTNAIVSVSSSVDEIERAIDETQFCTHLSLHYMSNVYDAKHRIFLGLSSVV